MERLVNKLLKTTQGFESQLLLILPHLLLLALFGVPIVREVLLKIKFTPFYVSTIMFITPITGIIKSILILTGTKKDFN
jgi:hypothetical protein